MSGNNASFYLREDSQSAPSSGEDVSYAAPSRQNQSSQEFDRISNEINQPIDYAGLGMKARKIKEGMGPLQVPIGQTIHGAIKDTEENTTLGDWGKIVGTGLGLAGLGYLWGKMGSQGGNQQPPNQPPSGPVPPTEPSPIELERLKREQLRTQREELRLQNEQDKIARANAQYEANQAAAQAKRDAAAQQKAAVPPLPDKDAEMLGNSMRAAQQKAIDADIKAQQAKQAVSQTTTVEAATSPAIEKAVAPNVSQVQPEEVVVEKPVVEVKKSVKPPAKAPKANVPMPEGWGKGMSWLVNQHGIEGAQDFIDRYNNGKPFAKYDDMMKSYQENTTRPKYSDIPKDVRKSRGIVPPPQLMGGGISGAAIPRTSLGSQQDLTQGGGSIIHMLNPLKM